MSSCESVSCKIKHKSINTLTLFPDKSILQTRLSKFIVPEEKKEMALKLISLKLTVLSTADLVSLDRLLGPKIHIHGDFHNENILFKRNKADHILDISDIRMGYVWEDVFQFIFLGCCNTGFKKKNIMKSQIFLREYKRLECATKAEIQPYLKYILYKRASSFQLEKDMVMQNVDYWKQIFEREKRIIELALDNSGSYLKNIL